MKVLPWECEEWDGELPCGMLLKAVIYGKMVMVELGEHVANGAHRW